MSKGIRKLLAMNAIFQIVAIYNGIFINLYNWERGRAIADVSLYNLSMFVCWGVSFLLAAKLLTRFSIRLLLAASALCGAAAFALLMGFGEEGRLLRIALLGVPVGAMFGFSAAAQNFALTLKGSGRDFAPYFSALLVISQALAMAVPFVSAKAIDAAGYAGSFVLMLAFVALMLGYSAFMPRITIAGAAPDIGRFRFRAAFGRPGSKWIVLSLLAAGVFLQFQNLFTLLFTFSVTENKLLIALLNVLYTCCSLLGLWLHRKLKRVDEGRWLRFGTRLMGVGFVVALLREPAALVVSNVLTTFGMFYFSAVWNAQQFRFIQGADLESKVSFFVWRECALIATRCLLLGATMPLKDMGGTGFALVIAATVLCLLLIPPFQHRALRAAGTESKAAASNGL